jgi:hypothetical protein
MTPRHDLTGIKGIQGIKRAGMGVWGYRSIGERAQTTVQSYDGQALEFEHWTVSFSAHCTLHSALIFPIPFIPVSKKKSLVGV